MHKLCKIVSNFYILFIVLYHIYPNNNFKFHQSTKVVYKLKIATTGNYNTTQKTQ